MDQHEYNNYYDYTRRELIECYVNEDNEYVSYSEKNKAVIFKINKDGILTLRIKNDLYNYLNWRELYSAELFVSASFGYSFYVVHEYRKDRLFVGPSNRYCYYRDYRYMFKHGNRMFLIDKNTVVIQFDLINRTPVFGLTEVDGKEWLAKKEHISKPRTPKTSTW